MAHVEQLQSDPGERPSTPGEYTYLTVAIAATVGIVVVFIVDLSAQEMAVSTPLTNLLIAATLGSWWAYFARRARVVFSSRMERLESMVETRVQGAEYAEGFVAGVSRRIPEER